MSLSDHITHSQFQVIVYCVSQNHQVIQFLFIGLQKSHNILNNGHLRCAAMAEKSYNARNTSRLKYAVIMVKTSAVKPIRFLFIGIDMCVCIITRC